MQPNQPPKLQRIARSVRGVGNEGVGRQTRKRYRGISLLPNAITAAAAFCGFFAALIASQGRISEAALWVFAAIVLDGMDGRVARLTKTQSDFGAQFDSLSDMISFGVAPAIIVFEFGLNTFGRLGVLFAFVYCICAALRLARFNTNIAVVNPSYFQGLPSPAAAALLAGACWWLINHDLHTATWLPAALSALTLFAGVSMVTNVPFLTFKHLNHGVKFHTLVVCVLILGLVFYEPQLVLLAIIAYAISGYLHYAARRLKGQPGIPTGVNGNPTPGH